MKTTEQVLPKARKENLVIEELPDEVLVYDLKRHKAHCLNRTAALVWEQCDGQTSVKQMVEILRTEFSSGVDEEIVWLALNQLSRVRLLEEETFPARGERRLRRREVIRRIGLTAAAGLPFVTSIIVPRAIQAGTCSCESPFECCFSGCPCRLNQQCCSGLCLGGVCA
jgi:hypothetical protein